jgi:hypothetical protein
MLNGAMGGRRSTPNTRTGVPARGHHCPTHQRLCAAAVTCLCSTARRFHAEIPVRPASSAADTESDGWRVWSRKLLHKTPFRAL